MTSAKLCFRGLPSIVNPCEDRRIDLLYPEADGPPRISDNDIVAVLPVGWKRLQESILQIKTTSMGHVTIPFSKISLEANRHPGRQYQLVCVQKNSSEVIGVSTPFCFGDCDDDLSFDSDSELDSDVVVICTRNKLAGRRRRGDEKPTTRDNPSYDKLILERNQYKDNFLRERELTRKQEERYRQLLHESRSSTDFLVEQQQQTIKQLKDELAHKTSLIRKLEKRCQEQQKLDSFADSVIYHPPPYVPPDRVERPDGTEHECPVCRELFPHGNTYLFQKHVNDHFLFHTGEIHY